MRGALDERWIVGQRECLGNEGEAFFDRIAATSVLRVVKAPDGLGSRFLELLERGPLLQQSAGHGRGEIFSAQFQGLGKVAFKQSLELIREPGSHVHASAPGFHQVAQLASANIIGLPRFELLAMQRHQLTQKSASVGSSLARLGINASR